jgi:tRNA(fMet)-specific endonuclease VapC
MTPRYLLDTDSCIYALTRRFPEVVARLDRLQPGEAVISVVVYGELLFGASGSRAPDVSRSHLAALISVVPVEPLPIAAAEEYAEIRSKLEADGVPIGANDLWIAAHARAAGLTLVTNNEREFRRVARLRVENWASPARVMEPRARYAPREPLKREDVHELAAKLRTRIKGRRRTARSRQALR